MSTIQLIQDNFNEFNTEINKFVKIAQKKWNTFSKEYPQLALTAKIVAGVALAALALYLAPMWTMVGLGVGLTGGFIFHKQVNELKNKVLDFYNDRFGLGKVGTIMAGLLLPFIAPMGFGIAAGALAGAEARNMLPELKTE